MAVTMKVSEVDCYKENADIPKNWFSIYQKCWALQIVAQYAF